MTTGCPPWCGKNGDHDLHTRNAGHDGEVSVSLVLNDRWDHPRLYIGHYRTWEDQGAVLLPLREAEDMARLMSALGHPGIAALITEAASLPARGNTGTGGEGRAGGPADPQQKAV